MNKFKEVSLSKLSYYSIPLKLMFNFKDVNKHISDATGFIFKHKSQQYLITCWHVITGKHNTTHNCLDLRGAIPNKIHFPLLLSKKPIEWRWFQLDLYENDDFSIPLWYEHPNYREKVDVIAILLNNIPHNINTFPINEYTFDYLKPEVSDEIFILGYPFSLKSAGLFPLWKRGSIASEPDFDHGNLPKILIDTAGKNGMSGAPVICRRTGIHNLVDGKMTNDSMIGTIESFLGVYSSHYDSDSEFEAQLGIIWKSSVILEIINNINDRK